MAEKKAKSGEAFMVVAIQKDLRRRFKVAVSAEGTNMRAKLRELIATYLAEKKL